VDWTDFVMIGGLCTIIAAFAFFFVYIVPRVGATRSGSPDDERFDGLRDLCAAFSSPSRHLRIVRTIQRSPSLASLCGFGAVVSLSVAPAYVGGDGWITKISLGEIFSLLTTASAENFRQFLEPLFSSGRQLTASS